MSNGLIACVSMAQSEVLKRPSIGRSRLSNNGDIHSGGVNVGGYDRSCHGLSLDGSGPHAGGARCDGLRCEDSEARACAGVGIRV